MNPFAALDGPLKGLRTLFLFYDTDQMKAERRLRFGDKINGIDVNDEAVTSGDEDAPEQILG
jgi:hypothetical protein